MPDAPTLDDVRALLRDNLREVLELVAVRERHREDTSLLLESADTYRLALAALDDAERVDALAWDLEAKLRPSVGGPICDALCGHDIHELASEDPEVQTNERAAYLRAFRAAIDAARREGA